MIKEYSKKEISSILNVINESSIKYKDIIPEDCWHEPYMLKQELINEFNNGVRMFGCKKDNKLIGVMGIQELERVTLIRHAYILTDYQKKGIGSLLLNYLFHINSKSSLLVGTWREAKWAVNFYKKFGFHLQTKEKTFQLLNKYWKISSKQIKHSVTLEKNND